MTPLSGIVQYIKAHWDSDLFRKRITPSANLMKVQRFDSLPLDATYFTDEGYLVDHPIVTSVGIFVLVEPNRFFTARRIR